jgi:hypothetical protein
VIQSGVALLDPSLEAVWRMTEEQSKRLHQLLRIAAVTAYAAFVAIGMKLALFPVSSTSCTAADSPLKVFFCLMDVS